jgi:hypothetical protein
MPMDSLRSGLAGEKFDGIYSNFGVINCSQRIDRVAADLARLVPPGAPLALVAMGRYVPWEWAWYLARGAGRKAFRRLNRDGVEWRGIHVSYPSPRMLANALRPHFVTQRASALDLRCRRVMPQAGSNIRHACWQRSREWSTPRNDGLRWRHSPITSIFRRCGWLR